MSASNPVRVLRLCLRFATLAAAVGLSPRVAAGPDVVFSQVPNPLGATLFAKSISPDHPHRIRAHFPSLDGEPLSISFTIDKAAARASMQNFGTSAAEIESLRQTCMQAQDCSQAQFDQHLTRYFRDHKLRLRVVPGKVTHLFVDIPAVVRHNRKHVRSVSSALARLAAERGGDAQWTFEAAISLVQAGLAYRRPSLIEHDRQTLGFYTPPRALEKGYGDCDTKSALLAAILRNLGESQIIGVRVPDHYLLGVARAPREGQAYLNYRGRPFVLIEASGPAQRRPGDIADKTRAALNGNAEIRIDPMMF